MPEWSDTLIRIGVVVVVAAALTRLALVLVGRIERRAEAVEGAPSDLQRRSKTLTSVVRSVVLVPIWTVAAITVLSQSGVAVGPALAAAGVIGIALGFGAQTLVRDLLAGFFILLEGQYDVGDVVEVADVAGKVEAVSMRTTVLRALDGRRHVVPNGEIRVSTNLTKVYSRYLMTLPVPYEEDVDRAVDVLRAVAAELGEDEEYRDVILAPLTVLGVDDFGESSVDVTCYVETAPGEQWRVGRELRGRLKAALDDAGISIPYPHREIVLRRAEEPPPGTEGDGTGAEARAGSP